MVDPSQGLKPFLIFNYFSFHAIFLKSGEVASGLPHTVGGMDCCSTPEMWVHFL